MTMVYKMCTSFFKKKVYKTAKTFDFEYNRFNKIEKTIVKIYFKHV